MHRAPPDSKSEENEKSNIELLLSSHLRCFKRSKLVQPIPIPFIINFINRL